MQASEIPDIVSAIRYAHRRRVVVVAAAGNQSDSVVAYPARAHGVIAVAATTVRGCQAEYLDASPAGLRIAVARADLVPPVAFSISATNQFGNVRRTIRQALITTLCEERTSDYARRPAAEGFTGGVGRAASRQGKAGERAGVDRAGG